jgi:hypothetical protein
MMQPPRCDAAVIRPPLTREGWINSGRMTPVRHAAIPPTPRATPAARNAGREVAPFLRTSLVAVPSEIAGRSSRRQPVCVRVLGPDVSVARGSGHRSRDWQGPAAHGMLHADLSVACHGYSTDLRLPSFQDAITGFGR